MKDDNELLNQRHLFDVFVAGFQLFCMPYPVQESYFEAFIYTPEGVISAIYDALVYVPQLLHNGLLPNEIEDPLFSFERNLDLFVDKHGVDFDTIHLDGHEWKLLKVNAAEILIKIGQKVQRPDQRLI